MVGKLYRNKFLQAPSVGIKKNIAFGVRTVHSMEQDHNFQDKFIFGEEAKII
jgi:hypothetical protein